MRPEDGGDDDYDHLIGETLDERYVVEGKLGEGGMGVVFRARHILIDKIVAVKVLKRDVAKNKNVITRFVQEAKAASRIGHPNIVDVTDFGVTKHGLTYQVMEFIDGPTLSEVLWKAEVPRLLAVILQIARALEAAHHKGIVHRDLKPDNVFVLQRGGFRDFVKITDFGIAKVFSVEGSPARRLTRVGSVFGTPEYMAPEQALGMEDVDHRVDIYSLGTILYERLVGHVPHRGKSPADTIVMQVEGLIVPPRQARPDVAISESLEALVLCALAKNRDERFANMNAFANALESCVGKAILANTKAPTAPETLTDQVSLKAQALSPAQPTSDTQTETQVNLKGEADEDEPNTEPNESLFDPDLRPRPRRWLQVAAWTGAVALVALAAVTIASVLSTPDTVVTVQSTGPDILPLPLPVAMPTSLDDAGTALATAPPLGDRDGGTTDFVPPIADANAFAEVRVQTVPAGGALYLGETYGGPDGTRIRRRLGARLVVGCRKPGHRDGRVTVSFDDKTPVAVCRLTRCVPGLKNPFGKCD